MTTKTKVMNDLYDAAVLTTGAVVISFVSRKLTKDSLGVPTSMMGAVKLALAFGLSSISFGILKEKKYLSEDPFKPTPTSSS